MFVCMVVKQDFELATVQPERDVVTLLEMQSYVMVMENGRLMIRAVNLHRVLIDWAPAQSMSLF